VRSFSRWVLSFALILGLVWSGSGLAQAAPPTPSPSPSPSSGNGSLGGLSTDTSVPVARGTSGSPARDFDTGSEPVKRIAGYDAATSTVVSRASRSTGYHNADGTQTLVVATEDVNYQDATGKWLPVDNTVVADPATGELVNRANGWQIRFADASKGMSFKPSVKSTGVVVFVPVNGHAGKPSAAGAKVTYAEVWPQADLDYVVTGSAVKETVRIKSKSAASSFSFTMNAGSPTDIARGAGVSPSGVVNSDGSVTLSSVSTGPVTVSAPMVMDAAGIPLEGSGAKYIIDAAGVLTLSIDPEWVAAQPDSAFPLQLDPTLSSGSTMQGDYKSDGYSCSNCGLRVGNSRDGGDKIWRSMSGYNWAGMAGNQILDAYINVAVAPGGLTGSLPIRAFWASAWSFPGTIGYGQLASGSTGGNIGGATFVAQVQSWANQGITTAAIGYAGDETPGVYSFQMLSTTLYVTYDRASSVTSLVPAVTQGAVPVVSTTTPTLSAAGSDPDGAVEYNFTISGSSDTFNGKASSGWQDGSSWQVPTGVLEEGQQYSWSVSVREKNAGRPAATASSAVKVDRRMGTGGPSPVDSLGGASVNLANGNLYLSASGHGVASVGGSLAVGLTYNSQLATSAGLVGSYYQETDRNWVVDTSSGELPSLVRVDSAFDMAWNSGSGVAAAPPGLVADQFMASWAGYLTVPASGSFQLGVRSDDGTRIWVNNTLVYDDWTPHGAPASPVWSSAVSLVAGQPVKVQVDYYNMVGVGMLQLWAKDPSGLVQLLPSSWLSPGLSTMPRGWSVTLPGGGNSYVRASSGYQSMTLVDSSGEGHTYLQTAPGAYSSPVGESGLLSGGPDVGWTLADDDGSMYTFNSAGQPTSARSATDALHPAAAVYTYDTTVTPARITTIHDPVSNQDIRLSYGTSPDCPATTSPATWDAAPTNMLCKITYWDNTSTVLHYVSGQLVAVEEPGTAITQFGYTDGLLAEVRGVLANDLIRAGKIADKKPETYTTIGYTWVQAPSQAQQAANVRPPFVPVVKTNGLYPAGSVPLVISVTGPAPDGVTTANRLQHSYDYSTDLSTTNVTATGIPGTASTVTYDGTGRTLTSKTPAASSKATTSTWDTAGKDLPVTTTDLAGRMSTTVYDWADRVTDTFGPAPAACFDAGLGRPLATAPAGVDCTNIPHSHTGYDTTTTGVRTQGLGLDQFNNRNLTGQPASRVTTASLDPSTWALTGADTSSRLTGEIALAPGTYTISADLGDKTDDGLRIYLGDTLVVDRWWTMKQAITADIPINYWTMASGTPTVGSRTLVPLGSVNYAGSPLGPVDTTPSAVFGGSTAYSIDGVFDNLPNSPSMELWFKTTTSGVIVGQEDATDTYFTPIMYVGTDGRFRASFWTTSGSVPIATATDVRDGQWHHVVLSTSQGTNGTSSFQTVYMDGALIGSKTDPAAYTMMHRVQIGSGISTGWPGGVTGWTAFFGQLAHVAIYNHPLDQTTAARHSQAGTASLTATTPVSFVAATPVVAGTLPTTPASTPQKVRVEYRNIHSNAASTSFTLKTTSAGTTSPIPISAFSTRYGLPTWQTTDDAGGVSSHDGKTTTATSYNGSGLDLQYGLATSTIADPGTTTNPAGISMTTTTAYEAPSSTTYLRTTGSALSSGTLSDPTKSTTTNYYGDTETRANPCVTGSPAVSQAGLAKLATKPASAAGSQISEESVYDAAGRVVAARYVGETAWTCTSYDSRGRATTVTTPAWGSDTTARTLTTNYAVNDDARVSSVSDSSGTTSATVDVLGRTVSYIDTNGVTTTTSYDVAGRTTSVTTIGGGVSSTLGYTYRDDGQVLTETLDGSTVASVTYDSVTAEVSGVTYPFGNVGSLVKYPSGALKGDTWTITQSPTNRTFTEQITRSQAGRVTATSWTDSSTAANTLGWGYTYDAVGRLTQANLAPAGNRSQVTFGYSYAKTGGCGADTAAGTNGSRTGSTVQIGTGTVASNAYCYDFTSRLTSVIGVNAIDPSAISYDPHGNATRIGDQTWVYDAADRVTGTEALSTGETLAYIRDVTGRVTTRVASGPDAGTTRYGFSTGDDSPDFQLDAFNKITEGYLSLPGGVLVTKPYNQPTASMSYSIPNWHGDLTAQASISSTGTISVSGGNWVNDPFGQPLNTSTGTVDLAATPTTRTGSGTADSWLGQHQRGYEHSSGLNQMLMGARTYLPALGIFTATDPVDGGNDTAYIYPSDPIGMSDLAGTSWWSDLSAGYNKYVKPALEVVAAVGDLVSFVPGPIGMIASGVAAAAWLGSGHPAEAALSAICFIPGGKIVSLIGKRFVSVAKLSEKVVTASAKSKILGPSSPLVKAAVRSVNNPIRKVTNGLPQSFNRVKGFRVGYSRGEKGFTNWRVAYGRHNIWYEVVTKVKR
jgi:YD repeat-containing protein